MANELIKASQYYNNITEEENVTVKLIDFKNCTDERACAVFALTSSLDVTYEEAQKFASEVWKRKVNRGARTHLIIKSFDDNSISRAFKKITRRLLISEMTNHYKVHGQITARWQKLKSFIKNHPRGVYYVLVSNHAIAVRDGIVYDTSRKHSLNKPIKFVWEIK